MNGVQTEQFTYDPVGNRLTSIDNPSWTYNTDNELTGYGATTMTYDANGNMTFDSSDGSTLTYDFENRLASYTTASTTAYYLYDPQGRRLQKTVNSVVTRYLWDGSTMIAELDGTNQVQRMYTYNPQSMEPVSTAIGCTAYFYITDHLMTPQMLTSMSDTTVWYAQYSAFGTATLITDTVTNNIRFPGQYADAESGLYYNYHRYYLPQAGRYAEIDHVLLSFLTFNPQRLQKYIYVLNNPMHWIDPFGRQNQQPELRACHSHCPPGEVYVGVASWTNYGGGCKCSWQCVYSFFGSKAKPYPPNWSHSARGTVIGEPDDAKCWCTDPDGETHPIKLPVLPSPEIPEDS